MSRVDQSTVEVRRAAARFRTPTPWGETRHSFSFGAHYDPGNTHHGLLVANNDDRMGRGGGYPSHPHRDMEIISWVLAGSLAHEDAAGREAMCRPGEVQRVSAGRGTVHAEHNEGDSGLHVVQMWVVPDRLGTEPGYEQRDVTDQLSVGDLVTVASGMGHDAVRIGNRQAALHVARLQAGSRVRLPEAPYLHVFQATGAAELDGAALGHGDAARLTGGGRQRLIGTEAGEVLVWEMHASLSR